MGVRAHPASEESFGQCNFEVIQGFVQCRNLGLQQVLRAVHVRPCYLCLPFEGSGSKTILTVSGRLSWHERVCLWILVVDLCLWHWYPYFAIFD